MDPPTEMDRMKAGRIIIGMVSGIPRTTIKLIAETRDKRVMRRGMNIAKTRLKSKNRNKKITTRERAIKSLKLCSISILTDSMSTGEPAMYRRKFSSLYLFSRFSNVLMISLFSSVVKNWALLCSSLYLGEYAMVSISIAVKSAFSEISRFL